MGEQVSVLDSQVRSRRNDRLRRGAAVLAAAAALGTAGLVAGAGTASAAAASIPVGALSPVYANTNVSSGKVGVPDLVAGDSIIANCWGRGQNLGSGNVWYHTEVEHYAATGAQLFVTGWTYGGSVDSNQAFHDGSVPAC